ncbi:MAG: DUF342 domain-containing protein [Lachnospiraceae bacterium]|nr:DUF342 domain-containing protein [Lachnospiraceae bacterium]
MQNGYFRLVNDFTGYGIALYQPKDFGEEIRADEVWKYLDGLKISYDKKRLEAQISFGEGGIVHLGNGECPVCPETYFLEVSEDGMMATVRFIPPSEGGERLKLDEFMRDIKNKKIVYGLQEKALEEHFLSEGVYCTNILVAKGKKPVQGQDAQIEYCFNTVSHKRPAHKEDGRVDYFNLTTINQCRKGEVLARIIPEQQGEAGCDVYGKAIKPREVKRETLKFGQNIELSEDGLSITSMVDGHVTLADKKVVVSSVYQVKGVNVSTGNINYDGSVEIAGNVDENFEVKAGGNVVVNGLVEGATIIAGGNIIIAKGMNGMGKGYLRARGDIIVKFLENSRIVTGGFVETEAILHCTVSAGSDVRVGGRKGIILGGRVQAANAIRVKTIGGSMSTATTLEVGVEPLLIAQLEHVRTAIEERTKTVNAAQVIFNNFIEKQKKGFQYNDSQLRYMRSVGSLIQEKNGELERLNARRAALEEMMEAREEAEIVVEEQVHPNTTLIIGNVSRLIQQNYRYCKFVKEDGEVRMVPM